MLRILSFLAIAAACNAAIVINNDQTASGALGTVHYTDNPSCNPCFGDRGGIVVRFDSTESLIAKGGQSRIESVDGLFTSMLITVPGFSFDRMVFRLFGPAAAGETVSILATDTAGLAFAAILPLGNNPSGKFFNIQSDAVEQIKSVAFNISGGGAEDLRQVRIGGFSNEDGGAVPEPATFLLIGAGLAVTTVLKKAVV